MQFISYPPPQQPWTLCVKQTNPNIAQIAFKSRHDLIGSPSSLLPPSSTNNYILVLIGKQHFTPPFFSAATLNFHLFSNFTHRHSTKGSEHAKLRISDPLTRNVTPSFWRTALRVGCFQSTSERRKRRQNNPRPFSCDAMNLSNSLDCDGRVRFRAHYERVLLAHSSKTGKILWISFRFSRK